MNYGLSIESSVHSQRWQLAHRNPSKSIKYPLAIPCFFFGISAPTIVTFGKVVRWALNTWKQVEEIKKVRADAQRTRAFTDKEMKDMFDTKIDESIKNAIETHVKELLPPEKSEPRHHELRTDLGWALDSILTRVE